MWRVKFDPFYGSVVAMTEFKAGDKEVCMRVVTHCCSGPHASVYGMQCWLLTLLQESPSKFVKLKRLRYAAVKEVLVSGTEDSGFLYALATECTDCRLHFLPCMLAETEIILWQCTCTIVQCPRTS